MENITFGNWLKRELQLRGMIQADLARQTGLTTASIANLVNDKVGQPTADTCVKIARALRVNPVDVMIIAGLQVERQHKYPELHELATILDGLSPEERIQVIEVARLVAAQKKR